MGIRVAAASSSKNAKLFLERIRVAHELEVEQPIKLLVRDQTVELDPGARHEFALEQRL